MAARWALKEAHPKGEVIRGLVPHVPDTYYIEAMSVSANDVVAPRPQHGALADLVPRL